MFLSALSLLFFARLVERYHPADLAAWSAVGVLALTSHYFSLFLLLVETAWLWRRLPRRSLLVAIAPPALTCLLLAPLVYLQRGHAHFATSLSTRLTETAQWFASGDLHSWPIWTIVAAVSLLAFALLLTRRGTERHAGFLALTVAATGLLLPLVLAIAGRDYFFFRNDQ